MSLTLFIMLSFASWRIANLLTDQTEAGPYDLLHRFRDWVGVRYDEYSQPYSEYELGKTFTCIWCLSVWLGFVLSGLYVLWPTGVEYLIAYPFGISGVVILLHKVIYHV